jgi:hypothetical protein
MLNATPSKEQLQAPAFTPKLELLQAIINKFLESTEAFFTSYLEQIGEAWWVEIVTKKPDCTYYFGPFCESPGSSTFSTRLPGRPRTGKTTTNCYRD